MKNSIKKPKIDEKKKIFCSFLNLKSVLGFVVLVIAVIFAKSYKSSSNDEKLRYWGVCVSKWNPNGNLRTMNRVFKKLGYEFVNPVKGDDWNVLWSIEYPFPNSIIHNKTKLLSPFLKKNFKLLSHQRINHFPGNYWVVSKSNLCILTQSKYLLPAFNFPDRIQLFKDYVAQHPNAKFVEKLSSNRGVRQILLSEINYEPSQKIYQVFMDNPFLIDGHFFDFGIHVLITSINPLRIYRYDHDVYIRFCPDKYHPFDSKNTRKYVVNEERLHPYDHPMFKDILFNYDTSYVKIFERIIKEKGFDVKKFWERVDDAITEIIIKNEPRIDQVIQSEFPNSTNFFELVRFDFVFDVNLNPYVMEINMSPGLTPFPGSNEIFAPYYEQMIFNTLRLIGAGSYFDFMSRFNNDTMNSNPKNLATNLDECIELNCADNCDKLECKVCLPCANNFLRFQMQESYLENSRRGNFKRVFPTSVHFNESELVNFLSQNNRVMMKWFEAKCNEDKQWC